MNKAKILYTLLIIGALAAIGLYVVLNNSQHTTNTTVADSPLLDQFHTIQSGPIDDKILTNDDSLQTYLKSYGPVATMNTLVKLTTQAATDCHEAAHKTGRFSYKIFGPDVFKLNLPECHSGFYHGSIEAFFKEHGTAKLQENLSTICQGNLNGFFEHQCMHGIGHGLMAWTSYDLPAALEYCLLLPSAANKSSCRTGVFMENIVGGLTDSTAASSTGHYTKYISDDPQYPCNIVKDEYKNDCYFLQTDQMLKLSKDGFVDVASDCAAAPVDSQGSCFSSMGRTVGGVNKDNPSGAIKACQFIPAGTNRVDCLLGAAQDTFWDTYGQQAGLNFCRLMDVADGKADCYDVISSRAADVLTPTEHVNYCNQMPAEYKSNCQKFIRS